jgi:hypothetical protein
MPNIPLNFFKRYSGYVTNSLSAVYSAPFLRAAVVLNGYITNTTTQDATITVLVSGKGDSLNFVPVKPAYFLAKDVLVAGEDTTNVLPSKLVLEASDILAISTSHPTPEAIQFTLGILETRNENQ